MASTFPPDDLYQYRPLPRSDSIRVVELFSIQESENVKIFLHETNLIDAPAFQTLSYEWGEPTRTHPVACGDGHILVTTNLLAALKRLRLPSLRRYVWIDGLCINQEDVKERTQQVSIMDRIYKAGDKVLIWLGEEGPGIEEALAKLDRIGQLSSSDEVVLRSFFSELYQRAREARIAHESHSEWDYDIKERLASLKEEKNSALQELKAVNKTLFEVENQPLWEGILGLFSRSYWNRLWIIQEVILSQRGQVICGPYSSDWDHFCNAASQIHDLGLIQVPPLTFHRILAISERRGVLWHKEREQYGLLIDALTTDENRFHDVPHIEDFRGSNRIETASLSFLLEQFSDSQATDLRDRVFALLSLVDAQGADRLDADYALAEGQVYLKTMSYVLSQERRSDLLEYFAPPSLSHVRGTPSWVPDLSCPRLWSDELIEPILDHRFSSVHRTTIDGESLKIGGIVYDKVAFCTIYMSPAEVSHFQPLDLIAPKNAKTFSDLRPPDMDDLILVIEDLPWKFAMSTKGFQHFEREWRSRLMRRIPQEEVFWSVLKSPNGQAALQMNGMPKGDFPNKFDGPTNLAGQILLDMYNLEADTLCKEFRHGVFINRCLRMEYCDEYLHHPLEPLTHPEEPPKRTEKLLTGDMALPSDHQDNFCAAVCRWAQQEWRSSMYVHKHGRQLFMFGFDNIGLGPPGIHSIKEGDVIARLDGGRHLCALRPQPDGSYTFRGTVILENKWYDEIPLGYTNRDRRLTIR